MSLTKICRLRHLSALTLNFARAIGPQYRSAGDSNGPITASPSTRQAHRAVKLPDLSQCRNWTETLEALELGNS